MTTPAGLYPVTTFDGRNRWIVMFGWLSIFLIPASLLIWWAVATSRANHSRFLALWLRLAPAGWLITVPFTGFVLGVGTMFGMNVDKALTMSLINPLLGVFEVKDLVPILIWQGLCFYTVGRYVTTRLARFFMLRNIKAWAAGDDVLELSKLIAREDPDWLDQVRVSATYASVSATYGLFGTGYIHQAQEFLEDHLTASS